MSEAELGITDEDRERLSELHRRRLTSDYHGHDGLPSATHPNVTAVRRAIEAIDEDFVKARDLTADVGLSPHAVGQALGRLEREGLVERFAYTGATTWRITS